ncbi:MAG: hypothetical protein WC178_00220 [Candidatus Paceibacterota bacterium]
MKKNYRACNVSEDGDRDNVLGVLPEGTLIKVPNDQKEWIRIAQAFQKMGLNWEDVDIVNDTEINAYEDAQDIE